MSGFEELWNQHKTDETEFNKWVAESIYRGQQAKIDEAIFDLQHIEDAMWAEQVEHVLMVLRGE